MARSHFDPFILTPIDNIYRNVIINVILYFPTSGADPTSVVERVKLGLAQTLERFPLLAGSVVEIPNGIQKGTLAVTGPWRTADQVLSVRHLEETSSTNHETLRAQHFPLVDSSSVFLPPSLLNTTLGHPAMLAQVNFIKGGTVLSISSHHAVVDGTGNAIVIGNWAAWCRGEDQSQPIYSDTLDRERMIQGPEGANLDDFPELTYIPKPILSKSVSTSRGVLSRIYRDYQTWLVSTILILVGLCCQKIMSLSEGSTREKTSDQTESTGSSTPKPEVFFFTKSKLKDLKGIASKELDEDGRVWISTTDALSSLLWCCITVAQRAQPRSDNVSPEARTERKKFLTKWLAGEHLLLGNDPNCASFGILAVLVNGRRLLDPPLSANYLGNVLIWGGVAAPISSVTSTIESVS